MSTYEQRRDERFYSATIAVLKDTKSVLCSFPRSNATRLHMAS